MKRFVQIFALLSFFAAIGTTATAKKKVMVETTVVDTLTASVRFVPNVTIYTPGTEICNEADNYVRYKGYSVFDLNNTEVLKVKASINGPVRLRLLAKDYIVKLNGQKSPVYRITIKPDQYNEFVIE